MGSDSERELIPLIDARLDELLPAGARYSARVCEAMRYSMFAGGKRMRPLLLLAAFQALGGEDFDAALDFACAVEMVHCYSLIHDDLPAMDDDDLRRGKPTNHRVYGEACAILAGDALLTKAFEVMAARAAGSKNRENAVRAMLRVAQAAGADGMVGGQMADIDSEGKQTTDSGVLLYIHENKTGALIRAAVAAGAMLAGADEPARDALDDCARWLGLAFQIKDDILDLTSTDAELGKPTGSDTCSQKLTYPAVFGMEQARVDFSDYSARALQRAEEAVGADTPFSRLIRRVTDRVN